MLTLFLVVAMQTEKVEEVNFDDLDEPGSEKVEVVTPGELSEKIPLPEYEKSPWLLLGPALCLFIVMWNVDWREARVKSETATRRQKKAPTKKAA